MASSTKRIEVSLGRTINTGNFESARLDVSYARDIGLKADVESEYEICWDIVEKEVNRKVKEIVGSNRGVSRRRGE